MREFQVLTHRHLTHEHGSFEKNLICLVHLRTLSRILLSGRAAVGLGDWDTSVVPQGSSGTQHSTWPLQALKCLVTIFIQASHQGVLPSTGSPSCLLFSSSRVDETSADLKQITLTCRAISGHHQRLEVRSPSQQWEVLWVATTCGGVLH